MDRSAGAICFEVPRIGIDGINQCFDRIVHVSDGWLVARTALVACACGSEDLYSLQLADTPFACVLESRTNLRAKVLCHKVGVKHTIDLVRRPCLLDQAGQLLMRSSQQLAALGLKPPDQFARFGLPNAAQPAAV